jgi:hypothetical protein
MNRSRFVIILLVLLGLVAFGWLAIRDRVMWTTGSKLAWRQDGVSPDGLSQWRWEIRIDGGAPVVLAATCASAGVSDVAGTYDCEALLPSMSFGTHDLEFRSWHTSDSGPDRGKSEGSAPSTLNVIVLPKLW